MKAYVLANFGGPKNTEDVFPFLRALLTDPYLTGNFRPLCLHRPFFTLIAKLRTKKVSALYQTIGGKSPIYRDTNFLAQKLRLKLQVPVIPFHRYLPDTHEVFLEELRSLLQKKYKITVLPLFPYFTYSVTGSIAHFFSKHLDSNGLEWIKSFGNHPAFVFSQVKHLSQYLEKRKLTPKNCILIFSAHGIPKSFVLSGDPYVRECSVSFQKIASYFPESDNILCYQSRFGPAKWVTPYTEVVCQQLIASKNKKNAVIIPFGFLSDHLETLYEIEKLYLPLLRENGFNAYRLPALGKTDILPKALTEIIRTTKKVKTEKLLKNI
ncbi:MAG: ferrochelatase [Victivallaceae bacterium]